MAADPCASQTTVADTIKRLWAKAFTPGYIGWTIGGLVFGFIVSLWWAWK